MPKMTLGQDLSAYCTIELPQGTSLTEDNLIAIAHQAINDGEYNGELINFNPENGTEAALRIVSVTDNDDEEVISDVHLESSPYDGGLMLAGFLKGNTSFADLIETAASLCLIEPPQYETQVSTLNTPEGVCYRVSYTVRKGATQEERDLALFHALCQKWKVDYAESK